MKKTNLFDLCFNEIKNTEEVLKMNENYIYRIKVSYFYYSGTFNSPENGFLRNYDGDILEFENYCDCENYIHSISPGNIVFNGASRKYRYVGDYYLSYGEYSSPEYKIYKFKKKSHSLV